MRPHLSINLRDLKKAVQFYSRVFGVKPQKQSKGYAKFDLEKPAFNFSVHEATDGRMLSRVKKDRWRQAALGADVVESSTTQ